MSASGEELHEGHLRKRCDAMGLTPIAEAPLRARSASAARSRGCNRAEGGQSVVEVTVADGYGKAVGVFTGRRLRVSRA